MSGPTLIHLKRKIDDVAPDTLLIQQPTKRQNTKSGHDQPQFHYVRQEKEPSLFDAASVQRQADAAASQVPNARQKPSVSGNGMSGAPSGEKERRTFHLKRPSTPETGIRKRKGRDDGIATFMERKAKHKQQELLDFAEQTGSNNHMAQAEPETLKRPGKGATIRANIESARKESSSSLSHPPKSVLQLQEMADSLHQFAMDEVAKEASPRPKVTALPKLPPQRSLELHRQRAAQAEVKMQSQRDQMSTDVEDDGEYVYDTYVLAPTSGAGAAQVGAAGALGNVGYLVISEDDQAIWETYLEDEPSDKDWDTDEEDENAEDWYGADYPDDELASDDEYDRNAYGYRAHATSDDEEWDEDTGNFSDEEAAGDSQPWRKKTPQQFTKYFD